MTANSILVRPQGLRPEMSARTSLICYATSGVTAGGLEPPL